MPERQWGQKHGKWLRTDGYPHRIYCSGCYVTYLQNEELARDFEFPKNFCPNCGIPMDLEEIHKKERMKAYGYVCSRYAEENEKELLKRYLQIDADLKHGVRMNGTATTLHTLRWAYKKVLRERCGWTVGRLRRIRKNADERGLELHIAGISGQDAGFAGGDIRAERAVYLRRSDRRGMGVYGGEQPQWGCADG